MTKIQPCRAYVSMKQIALSLLALLVLASCPDERIYDAFDGKDRTPPVLVSYELKSNSLFRVVYDEEVSIMELVFNGTERSLSYTSGTLFDLTLPHTLERGEEAVLSLTVEDESGNSARSSFTLIGLNDEIPDAVINEVSSYGSGTNADRVEILFLSDGNTAGMLLADGTLENCNYIYSLEDIDVEEGDMFVIFWDTDPTLDEVFTRTGGTTWSFGAESSDTLSGKNGALILYKDSNGNVMDGLVYTNGEAESYNGYGNSIAEDAATYLISEGEWTGDPFNSAYVTATRVMARIPDGYDTDSADDWYTTQTKGQTFGYINVYSPYEE